MGPIATRVSPVEKRMTPLLIFYETLTSGIGPRVFKPMGLWCTTPNHHHFQTVANLAAVIFFQTPALI
jgi:hypothetical protein